MVSLDVVQVNGLLDVVLKTAGTQSLKAINEAATLQLAQINSEVEAELRPPPPEARKAA